jgi:hypothetical protein
MKAKVLELFAVSTSKPAGVNWSTVVTKQFCPFLNGKCLKVRKSQPQITIGTCSVMHGRGELPVIICPFRLLERKQVFTDCIHLLTLHEPGNELHIVPEVTIPGGSVDYFLVSALNGKVKDFVAIELQTLDTTGTVWPERQRFLASVGVSVKKSDVRSTDPYGMNWKMTAKTILVQLHHKVQTFENLNKHIVLVIQDHLLEYIRREFSFDHVHAARLGDPMQIHAYRLKPHQHELKIALAMRLSTDRAGISKCLGLRAEANVELAQLVAYLEPRLSKHTLLTL